jgi:hypothetical protein
LPKPLAEIVLDAKLVSREQVSTAARHADKLGQPMVVSLVRELGLDELALVGVIRREVRVPLTDPAAVTLDSDALRVLPRDAARRLRVLPLSLEVRGSDKFLEVAVADPTDTVALAEIEHLTGCRVYVSLMPLSAIEEMVEKGYRQFVTEVMPRKRKLFGQGVSVATTPLARPPGDSGQDPKGPSTVPFHRVSDEAELMVRHRALLRILIAKNIISEDEYEAEVLEMMKERDDEA